MKGEKTMSKITVSYEEISNKLPCCLHFCKNKNNCNGKVKLKTSDPMFSIEICTCIEKRIEKEIEYHITPIEEHYVEFNR
jgi:hypothetical protein